MSVFQANTVGLSLTASNTTVYTVGAGKQAMIHFIQGTNIDGANSANFTVWWTDNSVADTAYFLSKPVNLIANNSTVVAQKLNLSAGDRIRAACATGSGKIHLTVSLTEYS